MERLILSFIFLNLESSGHSSKLCFKVHCGVDTTRYPYVILAAPRFVCKSMLPTQYTFLPGSSIPLIDSDTKKRSNTSPEVGKKWPDSTTTTMTHSRHCNKLSLFHNCLDTNLQCQSYSCKTESTFHCFF